MGVITDILLTDMASKNGPYAGPPTAPESGLPPVSSGIFGLGMQAINYPHATVRIRIGRCVGGSIESPVFTADAPRTISAILSTRVCWKSRQE